MQLRSLTNLLHILSGVLAAMLIGYAGSETPLEKNQSKNLVRQRIRAPQDNWQPILCRGL